MNCGLTICSTLTFLLLFLVVSNSFASAARCQISGVSYVYPNQASVSQEIQVETIVTGSCASNGEDYYAVRVDLVDTPTGTIISSSSTPIGRNATDFNVTAVNPALTPSTNMTWPLQMHVYVIRAGGTNGVYLLDYQAVGNATIQVGATMVPEFQLTPEIVILVTLLATSLIFSRRILRERT